jgi:hypothetical protein
MDRKLRVNRGVIVMDKTMECDILWEMVKNGRDYKEKMRFELLYNFARKELTKIFFPESNLETIKETCGTHGARGIIRESIATGKVDINYFNNEYVGDERTTVFVLRNIDEYNSFCGVYLEFAQTGLKTEFLKLKYKLEKTGINHPEYSIKITDNENDYIYSLINKNRARERYFWQIHHYKKYNHTEIELIMHDNVVISFTIPYSMIETLDNLPLPTYMHFITIEKLQYFAEQFEQFEKDFFEESAKIDGLIEKQTKIDDIARKSIETWIANICRNLQISDYKLEDGKDDDMYFTSKLNDNAIMHMNIAYDNFNKTLPHFADAIQLYGEAWAKSKISCSIKKEGK